MKLYTYSISFAHMYKTYILYILYFLYIKTVIRAVD